MPWMLVKDGDKVCVHKQNTDKTAGESLHCYTGPTAEAQAKKYMAALYANAPDKNLMSEEFLVSDNVPGHIEPGAKSGYMKVTQGDQTCVHKMNADGTAGAQMVCFSGPDAGAQCDAHIQKMDSMGAQMQSPEGQSLFVQFMSSLFNLANTFGGVKRTDLKDSDFVFPDDRAFPIMTSQDVKDAVSSWGRYKGKHSFDEFKSKLTALAKRKGFDSALPAIWSPKTQAMSQDFNFTELADYGITDKTGHSYIDGLAAGTFTSMSGDVVTFDPSDLQAYIENTNAIIESTRTARGEIVGLPIDENKHDHAGGAGWIVGLRLDKTRNVIEFLVNWTQQGINLIKNNTRRFFSPSADPANKVILGGSLTNWPATRSSNTGQILLRPVELSQHIKEIDMPKTLEEMFTDLRAAISAIGQGRQADGQPDQDPAAQAPAPRFDGASSPTIQQLLQSPEVVEELGRKATELAQDAIRTEKRKLHVMEFASKIAGGTKDRPFGLAVQPTEIIAVLLALPEKQALAVEKLLEKTLDRAVDFAQYGFDADGYVQKPTLPKEVKPYAEAWVKSGKPIKEFFMQNPEVGDPDSFNLSEFEKKES